VIYSKLHPGQYLYRCRSEECPFKTNLAKELKAHLVRVHGEEASLAASYVAGLYQPLEDGSRTNIPVEIKPRKRFGQFLIMPVVCAAVLSLVPKVSPECQ
jgi:hypothetical protein